MKKAKLFIVLIPLTCFFLTNCNETIEPIDDKENFGVFLGEEDENISYFYKYKNIAIDIDNFSNTSIKDLKDHDVTIYSYLSVGSLEKYRSYYNEFKDLTFMDYDNWPDERWIDVSNTSWQNHILSEAQRMKNSGTNGLFLDNFDVYYIVCEEYECSNEFKENIYQGCRFILRDLHALGLSLIINSGTDFLERLNDEDDSLINAIDIYAQECVFSSIIDYEKDIFGKQNKEDQDYYFEIIEMMKEHSNILLIEYTTDTKLIENIEVYCFNNNFDYYISNNVDLKR